MRSGSTAHELHGNFQRSGQKPAFWNADTMMHHVVGERMILISMQRDVLVDGRLPLAMPKFWKLPESKKTKRSALMRRSLAGLLIVVASLCHAQVTSVFGRI